MQIDWTILNSIVQWLVLPMIAVIWKIYEKTFQHDRDLTRLLTMFEEREKARLDIRIAEASAIDELKRAIENMNGKLEELSKSIARMQGHVNKSE